MILFRDRMDAGRQLAARLAALRGEPDVIVLALPRGGAPVAFEVAAHLQAPLDVLVVRKLGAPGHEEYALGAIAPGGVRVVNEAALSALRVSAADLEDIAAREARELARREAVYRAGRPPYDLHRKTVVLVDDGLATGATMHAAVAAARRFFPKQVIVAVPLGASDTCRQLARVADEVVCLAQPEPFRAVGLWYGHFDQTDDQEVQELLERRKGAGS